MSGTDTVVDRKVKPEKPDEELFNTNLKKVQKEHADLMEKLVSGVLLCNCGGVKMARTSVVRILRMNLH